MLKEEKNRMYKIYEVWRQWVGSLTLLTLGILDWIRSHIIRNAGWCIEDLVIE
jgi:hypothetical protein